MNYKVAWSGTCFATDNGCCGWSQGPTFAFDLINHNLVSPKIRGIDKSSIGSRDQREHIGSVSWLRPYTACFVLLQLWIGGETSVLIKFECRKISSTIVRDKQHPPGRIYAYMTRTLTHG